MEKKQTNFPKFSMPSYVSIWLFVKIAVLSFSVIGFFFNDFTIIFSSAIQSEATSYLLSVPFIFMYLLYRKRKMLIAVISVEKNQQSIRIRFLQPIIGMLAILTAIFLYWYGTLTFMPVEYHMISLPIFSAGLVLILFDYQTLRQLAFPISFLFFLIPPPSEMLFMIGGTLSTLSSQASNAILHVVGIPSTLIYEYNNPTISILRPDGTSMQFALDIACSGIYSLVGFFVFATVIAYVIRDTPLKKISIIALGIPIIYFFNIIRIISIVLIGYQYGEFLALEVFHILGGLMLIFVGTILLLLISEKLLKARLFETKLNSCSQCANEHPSNHEFCFSCGRILKLTGLKINKIDIVKMFAIVLSIFILLSIQAPVFALTKSPAEEVINAPAGQQTSVEILPEIPNYTLKFYKRDVDFERMAKIDMAVSFSYTRQNNSLTTQGQNISLETIWVSIEISSILSHLHRWETCLINYPLEQGLASKADQVELLDIQLAENPPIISRYFAFQAHNSDKIQGVLYWYESAAFTVNSTLQPKHVKISLINFLGSNEVEEIPQTRHQLEAVAEQIIAYWQPITTWSPMALTISENGAQLTGAAGTLLFATVCLCVFEIRRQKQINKSNYQKFSNSDKRVIEAIRLTEKTNASTLENIAASYNKGTREGVDKGQLFQKLCALERIGIITRDIIKRRDEPFQVWKT